MREIVVKTGVVGAGFAGSYISLLMAREGVDVTVYEALRHPGRKHCTGLVGIRGLEMIGLRDFVKGRGLVMNAIRSALFCSFRSCVLVESPDPVAYVIERVRMDREILGMAVDAGANLLTGVRVRRIRTNGELEHAKGSEKFDVIVDAEGPGRVLIRDLPGVSRSGLLPALQIDVRANARLPEDRVEVHFLVPDFFLWIVPLGGSRWRIGGASSKMAKSLGGLVRALARKRLGSYTLVDKFGGIVVAGGPIRKFVWGRIIAVGDAAGQTKPTTGGGVVIGGLSARIAAKTVTRCEGSPSSLVEYELEWKRVLGKRIRRMLLIRRLLNALGVRGIDGLMRAFPRGVALRMAGDFDFQDSFINPLAEKSMTVTVRRVR